MIVAGLSLAGSSKVISIYIFLAFALDAAEKTETGLQINGLSDMICIRPT